MAELSILASLSFKTTTCITCGCPIAMVNNFYDSRLKDHVDFYCPNGHSQHFIDETEEQKLKKQLERVTKEKEWAEQATKRAREAADHSDRRRAAAVGRLTRMKKRVQNGVCPCCKRSFENLHRHMTTKHPDYAEKA